LPVGPEEKGTETLLEPGAERLLKRDLPVGPEEKGTETSRLIILFIYFSLPENDTAK